MFQCFKPSHHPVQPTLSSNTVSSTYTISTTTPSKTPKQPPSSSSPDDLPPLPLDTSSPTSTGNKVLIQFIKKCGLNTTVTRTIVKTLIEEGFDSLSALKTLTEQDLKDMRIKNGHTRVLLPAIHKLKDTMQRVDHTTVVKTKHPIINKPSLVNSRVESWLKSIPGNLILYGKALARSGYDSLESICLMEPDDIHAVVPEHKSGHRKIFLRAHAHLKTRLMHDHGQDGFVGTHPSSGQPLTVIGQGTPGPMAHTSLSASSRRALGMKHTQTFKEDDSSIPPPLPIDTPHLYILSGRSRVPLHMKRHTGDGQWKRWDVYPQTAERYNYITDTWSGVDIDPCWGAGVACGDGNGHIFSLTGFAWSPIGDGLVEMPLPSVVGRTWGDTTFLNRTNSSRRGQNGLLFSCGGFGGTATNSSNGESFNDVRSSGNASRLSPIAMDRKKNRSEMKSKGKGLTQVVDVYDVGKGEWYNVNPLRTPRHSLSLAATALGGRNGGQVFAVGGSFGGNQQSVSGSGRRATGLVEVYDVKQDRWESTGHDMSTPRMGCGAVTTEDGCLYVMGGSNSLSKTLRAMEFYDGRIGRFSNLAPMIKGRSYFGAGVLPNGDVMVVGGKQSQSWTTSCEIFDVKGGRWRTAASCSQLRHSVPHTTYASNVASGRRPRGYSVAVA